MADDKEVVAKLGVDTTEVPKFTAAAGVIQSGVASMKLSMESLKGAMESLKGVFIAVTAVLAGGALFKSAVKETMDLTTQVTMLTKKLGGTREEASILNVALKHIGMTSEEYIGIITKMDRMLRTNEQSLKDMGVVTRKANGEYADQKDILDSGLKAIMQYKEGTDRNLASMMLFGRSVDSVTKLQKLNNSVMEEAAKTAKAFGLIMGQDLADQTIKLKLAMATVSTAGEAIEVAIGRAVMPRLIEMANYIKDNAEPIMQNMKAVIGLVTESVVALSDVIGGLRSIFMTVFNAIANIVNDVFGTSIPNDFNIFASAINVLRTAIAAFEQFVAIVFESIRYAINQTTNSVMGLLDAWRQLQSFSFSGASDAMSDSAKRTEQLAQDHADALAKIVKRGQDKVDEIWNKKQPAVSDNPDTHLGGNKRWTGNDDQNKAKPAKDMLAAKLALLKAGYEAELAEIKDNEARAQNLYDEAYARNLISTKEYYDARLEIANVSADKEIETKKKEIEAAQQQLNKAQAKKTPEGEKEILQFRAQLIKMTSDLTILESHRAEAAINNNHKMLEAERARAEKIEQIEIASREKIGIDSLATQKQIDDARLGLELITAADLIELDRKREIASVDIHREAILEKIALEKGGTNDPIAVKALNDQLLDLQRQHEQTMLGLNLKAAEEYNRPWKAIQDTLRSSMEGTINSLLTGTMSLASAMKNILISLGQSMVSELVTKPLLAKIIGMAQEKVLDTAKGTSAAGLAGAEAVSAVAGIPIVGPALAAVAGPETFALAEGFAAISASAAGGYDIPSGINPMVQTHAREMILPEKHSDVIRNLADGNGGGGTNITIHAMDAASIKRLFRDNGPAIVASLKNQGRNFAGG